VAWDLLPSGEVQATLARIRTTTSLEEASGDASLVVEAVVKDLALKEELFRELDGICPPHTFLVSNASSFVPSLLAPATGRREQVVVAHFFYPPPLMPLVEVVRGPGTTDRTVETVCQTLEAASKSPIVVQKEAMGFLANRLQLALLREALYIVSQGIATAQDVDTAVCQSFGRRLAVAGPPQAAEVQDGWDVIRYIQEQIQPDLDQASQPSPLLNRMIEHDEVGPRSGQGFYPWSPASAEAWEARLRQALAQALRANLIEEKER
jgi:3-hydroxybutyryl-CoA dehydrogenase